MRKILCAALVLAISCALLIPSLGISEDKPYTITYTTISGWGLRLARPLESTMSMKSSDNYLKIFTQESGYIPYVMVEIYGYDTENEFIEDLTEYLQNEHDDLTIVSPAEKITIGGKECYEIVYTFGLQGYTVTDRRVVIAHNGHTYDFCAKEVKELNQLIGSLLDEMVELSEFVD